MSKCFRHAAEVIASGAALFIVSMMPQGISVASSAPRDTLDVVNHRYYALDSWRGVIGLPDDPFKTVVDADGTFWTDRGKTPLGSAPRQGIYPLALYQSPIKIHCRLEGTTERVDQRMYSPRVPISIAHKRQRGIAIEERLFLAAPLDWSAEVTGAGLKGRNSLPRPSQYLLMTEYTNTAGKPAEITPVLDVQGAAPMPNLDDDRMFELSQNTFCRTTLPIDGFKQWESSKTMYEPVLRLKRLSIPPGQKVRWVLTINRHGFKNSKPVEWAEAERLCNDAITYWQKSAGLPYDVIQIPDNEIQAILDTSTRELYQMRYVINDLPAFFLGPTGYSDYWVFDGSIMAEAADMLGRTEDASGFADYLLLHQHEDGRIQALTMHWKETGIALIQLYRHGRMVQNKHWLRERWPQVRRAVSAIEKLRRVGSSADPRALTYQLSPEAFGDGGVMDITAEFTTDHWLLAGLKAAVEAAQWLGEVKDFEAWGREYEDFERAFQRAIARDAKTDGQGNRYIPSEMGPSIAEHPPRGQWGFMHGVYPGRIFAKDDPLMLGTMRMLEAHEVQVVGGLFGSRGSWASRLAPEFNSFYAHDWLWLGEGRKAARLQYAIANHASPVWNYCETTRMQTKPGEIFPFDPGCGGDMPDILATAEFIRLTGHLLAFDRGQELHLFEGLPPEWLRSGMTTRLNGMGTPFGPLTLELKVAADGKTARLKVAPLSSPDCSRIVVHLGGRIHEVEPRKGREMNIDLL